MAVAKVLFGIVVVAAVVLAMLLPAAQAQSLSPAQAPAPASDGTSIDQGIAYVLMLVALVLTYLIHAADLPFSF